ncbi:MAG: 3-oxoacyl-ACP synthase III family protein [Deltaproteobacteria bacterium]
MENIVITGTGSFIPERIVKNDHFLEHEFYDENRQRYTHSNEEIIQKFKDITGIEERRWVSEDMKNSDMSAEAARKAIENAGIDPETLDLIIVGHNVGDINPGSHQTELIPSIANRVKNKLGIKNSKTVSFDIIFGCPGWLQGVITAFAYMRAGIAKKALVIGSETLSRTIDEYDRDSMIFADGAGATIFEVKEEKEKRGILSIGAVSDTIDQTPYLSMGHSYGDNSDQNSFYVKMQGRKIYEYALTNVPLAMKETLEKSQVDISEIKKIFIHQANEKMDHAIINRFYRLFGIRDIDPHIMPMSIDKLGNSSTATIPTLLDSVLKLHYEMHEINEGDATIFASVGAGMNINAIVYKF